MTEREQAINRDLRTLDDAHRLGRLSQADYRARRRRLLEPLFDGDGVVTARKALVSPDAMTAPRQRQRSLPVADNLPGGGHALTMLLSMRPAVAWKPLLVLVAGVVILIALTWWLLRTP
jgi:hypothetical protein